MRRFSSALQESLVNRRRVRRSRFVLFLRYQAARGDATSDEL
jgi:hypothetical protein